VTERKGYRGYITSRPFMGERAPQHIQNLVIRDYAKRNGLDYLLSATEYAMQGSALMLRHVLDELPKLDGIICYSIFQLPADAAVRAEAYRRVIETGAELHAAVEGLVVRTAADAAAIEDIWRVRQVLAHCAGADSVAAAAS
jgi:sporadic carbohydrate cluster protein (TIGR04323 family)